MLTLPPTLPVTALDALAEAPVILTAASGVWVPPPGLQRALLVATAPGAAGIAGVSSGGAGGTAIGIVDLTLVASLPYQIGPTTSIATLAAAAGSGINPGAASGGMLNLTGGCGFPLSNFVDLSAAYCVRPSSAGFHQPLFAWTATSNAVPGGLSFWGGCDAAAPNAATVYGAGGSADGGSPIAFGASTTSRANGTGSKSFVLTNTSGFTGGMAVRATSAGTGEWMEGTVASIGGLTVVFSMTSANGSGTHSDYVFTTPKLAGAGGPGVIMIARW